MTPARKLEDTILRDSDVARLRREERKMADLHTATWRFSDRLPAGEDLRVEVVRNPPAGTRWHLEHLSGVCQDCQGKGGFGKLRDGSLAEACEECGGCGMQVNSSCACAVCLACLAALVAVEVAHG